MWTRLLYRFFGFNSNCSLTYVSSSTMYFLVLMTMIIIMIHESCSVVHNITIDNHDHCNDVMMIKSLLIYMVVALTF